MSDCFYPFVCLSKSVHMYVKHIRYFFICMRMLNSFVLIFFVAFLPFTPIYGYLQPDFYRPQGFSLSNIRKCSNKSFFFCVFPLEQENALDPYPSYANRSIFHATPPYLSKPFTQRHSQTDITLSYASLPFL